VDTKTKKILKTLGKIFGIIIAVLTVLVLALYINDKISLIKRYRIYAPKYNADTHIDVDNYEKMPGYVPIGNVTGYYLKASLIGGQVCCKLKDVDIDQFAFEYTGNFMFSSSLQSSGIVKSPSCDIDPLKDWTIDSIELCSLNPEGYEHGGNDITKWEKFHPNKYACRESFKISTDADIISMAKESVTKEGEVNNTDLTENTKAICVLRIYFKESGSMAFEAQVLQDNDRIYIALSNVERITSELWVWGITNVTSAPDDLAQFILQSVPEQEWVELE